jgi:hypothetical protein
MTHDPFYDNNNYYDRYKDPQGCKQAFIVMLVLLGMIILSIILCETIKGQSWQHENKGLYPNSIQGTMNARNESVGIRYTYLFQQPVLNMPLGIYGSFSNTIPINWRLPNYAFYNNYAWERKYSVGLLITLPTSLEAQGMHSMATIGIIHNSHPYATNNEYPGRFDPDLYYTNYWGCDIGVQVQINRFTSHLTIDFGNFFRYAEIGAGYCFLYR